MNRKFTKIITIILTLTVALAAILIIPANYNYNKLKLITLLISGPLIIISLLVNYKTLTIDKKDITILIFLGIACISTFLSSDIEKSIIGELYRYEGLLMYITYICIYFGAKKYFKYERISIFLNIMFYISILIGILGIAQKYVNCKELYPIFNKGICSTFGNSNFFGNFISIVLPIATAGFIVKGSKKSFILSLIMFFNMIASGTRSAWTAFIVIGILGLIYLIKQRNKQYFKRTVFLTIFFAIICIYLFNGFGFISKTLTNSNINSANTPTIKIKQIKDDLKKLKETGLSEEMGSGRIRIWKMTIELITKKPIFGVRTRQLTRRTN